MKTDKRVGALHVRTKGGSTICEDIQIGGSTTYEDRQRGGSTACEAKG